MTGRKKFLISTVIGIILVGLVVLGVLFLRQESPEKQREKVVVRLKWLHQAQFAGFYYAQQAGYYDAEGLDVTLNPGGVDFPAIQMVSGGSEQFGVTAADQILLAREKGVPIVTLAVIYRKSPMVYFSLKGSGISKPRDFVGKRVGIKLGGNEEVTYRAMMRRLGINMKSIQEIPVKYDITPLFTGKVDVWPGYAINEPIVAQEKGYEVTLIWPSDYGVNMYADAIFTTEEIIRSRPELLLRFLRATLKGWRDAINDQTKAVDYTLKYSDKLQKDHETAMLKASIELLQPDNDPIGWMSKERWEEMQRLLLEQKFMKQAVPIDDVFTMRFLREIYGR